MFCLKSPNLFGHSQGLGRKKGGFKRSRLYLGSNNDAEFIARYRACFSPASRVHEQPKPTVQKSMQHRELHQ